MKKITFLFSLFFFISYSFAQNEFTTIWKPGNSGLVVYVGNQPSHSTSSQIYFPGVGTNYTISWEEVGFPSHNGILNNVTSTLGNAVLIDFGTPFNPNSTLATYNVKVSNGSGNFSQMVFSSEEPSNDYGDTQKILDIVQWGDINWKKLQFVYCIYLDCTANDNPIFLPASNLSYLFYYCEKLKATPQINNWNTANVTDMSYAFYNANLFNQSISNWNTQNVTNMSTMFFSADIFNQDITDWDTSKVTNMSYMFAGALAFNQNIGKWNTSNVTDMSHMFKTSGLNQSLNNWDTSKVTNMELMFYNSNVFNGDIGNWNTSSVTNMNGMFLLALIFNKPIGNWNTSNVTNMSSMFYIASSFNQPIGNWDISKVTNTSNMFSVAATFNQNIENWNTSNVTDMSLMFFDAIAFNQNLGKWSLPKINNAYYMLYNTALDCVNYDKTLIGWANNISTPNNINFGNATPLIYSSNGAVTARDFLINTKNWLFEGDIYNPTCTLGVSSSTGSPDLTLYPNPVKDYINFSADINEISIYDSSGKLIMTKKVTGNAVDVSSLLPGNYIIKLISKDEKSYLKRIIKY